MTTKEDLVVLTVQERRKRENAGIHKILSDILIYDKWTDPSSIMKIKAILIFKGLEKGA